LIYFEIEINSNDEQKQMKQIEKNQAFKRRKKK